MIVSWLMSILALGTWALARKWSVEIVGIEKFTRAVRGWSKDFDPPKRNVQVLFGRLGRALRDDVRNRITTQGGGSWAPLGKWARARTGRRKALITERSRVKFSKRPNSVRIFYAPRSDKWDLTDHHEGFTTPGFSGKKLTIPLRNPSALKVKGSSITILSAKPSVVPARKIWTSPPRALAIARPIIHRWATDIIRKRAK